MKLLLIRYDTENLNRILETLNEDTHAILIERYETLESFQNKVQNLELSELNNVALCFDNLGNRAPFFEFTPEELNIENEKIEEIIELEEGQTQTHCREIYRPKVSAFINSGTFFSQGLKDALNYLQSQFQSLTILDILSSGILLVESIESFEIRTEDNLYIYLKSSLETGAKNFSSNSGSFLKGPRGVPVDGNLSTPEDLLALMQSTATADMTRDYNLMNDIDMSGYESESIGKLSFNFKGNFNGNNYTIKINETKVNSYYGLFWYVGGSSNTYIIQDLNVVYLNNGFDITFTTNPGDWIMMGGIAGYSSRINYTNCNVTYTEDTNLSANYNYIINRNVIIGGAFGYTDFSIVNNCNVVFEKRAEINAISLYAIYCSFYSAVNSNFQNNNCSLICKDTVILNNEMNNPSVLNASYNSLVFSYIYANSTINNFNAIFEKNVSLNNINKFVVYSSLFVAFLRESSINNCSLICKDDVNIVTNMANQNINSFNCFNGAIAYLAFGNINGLNINLQNFNIQAISQRNSFLIGALCGYSINITDIIGDSNIANYNLQCKDFNVDCIRPDASSTLYTASNNIGGGFGRIATPGIVTNCSMVADNINLNFTQQQQNPLNNTYLGGFAGYILSQNASNTLSVEYCSIIVNKNFNINANLNYNNLPVVPAQTPVLYAGGFCGLCRVVSDLSFIPKFNTGFINNYNFNVNIDPSITAPGNIQINSGGVAGRVWSNSAIGAVNLNNTCVFFGESSIQNIPSGPNSFVGGVIGRIGFQSVVPMNNATNCACIYNNYKIVGQTYNKTIGQNTGIATDVLSISYGAPIDSEGVQDIDGPSTTNAVIALFNSNINTEWLAFLLKFRQSLDSSLPLAEYLNEVLNVSTSSLSKTVLNAAFQNSMYFNGITNFETPFLYIKDSLIDYTDIPDDALVEYLIPTDNVYTINDKKLYYLFQNLASIKNKDLTVPYSIQYEPASIVMTDDNTEKVTLLGEESTLSNDTKIKFSGIGSGLVEIIPPVTPVPPTPSGSNTNNWWWITILIVFAIILCVVIFLIFFCDKSPKIDFISLNI